MDRAREKDVGGLSVLRGAMIAVLALGCAVAFAQTPFAPQWLERPAPVDIENAYPEAAVEAGAPGIAVLCCTPRDDGRLACVTAYEWPEGGAFGAATLTVVEKFRMAPESVAAFRAEPRDPYRIAIPWTIGGVPENYAASFNAALAAARRPDMCKP